MTEVLFVATKRPELGILADSVGRFRDRGARVHLAGTFHVARVAQELSLIALDGVHQLPRGLSRRSGSVRRRAKASPVGMRVWLQSQRDRGFRRRALRAQVIVALDPGAVYTVWRLARYNPTAEAHFGVVAALTAFDRRGQRETVPRRVVFPAPGAVAQDVRRSVDAVPAAVMRAATARPVMRSALGARLWRSAVSAPGVPVRARVAAARYVAEGMRWAGRTSGAAMALTTAASRIPDLSLRAKLLDEGVMTEIAEGISPRDLHRAVGARLAQADEQYAEGNHEVASEALNRAMFLCFHRMLHVDGLSSPLVENARDHTASLQVSTAFRAVSRPRGRQTPAASPPAGRPLRLLVTTSANANFLHHVLSRYENHPRVELRYLDLAAQRALNRISWAARLMLEDRLAGGTTGYQAEVERLMRPHLDWADTVFLDWSVGPASMLTTIDPGDTRIVVRLHSYEAFTRWPHMTDFSRVDDLVFVAPHVKDLVTSLVPHLRGAGAPRTHLLDNAMELSRFVRPKPAEARFNLGLIGVSQVAKDPLWAVDVLKRVREHDERYRLLLVGGDMDPRTSRATGDYRRRLERVLRPLVASGAVVRLGPTDDVPGVLSDIGVILSSSLREGCHVGLMEGAASAALPVVRDWPFYAGRANSARTLYPEGWVVGSPEEAARRILDTTSTEESWRAAGGPASEHALSAWDWSVVGKRFDRFLLGEG
ncbi:glycosyltransferase family 1 protein [Streptomyces sp. HB132]|uniref:glycosyltransferase family 1 protein n=1 Tax=Streptomyces sp. HB132 TaxID=767388 RepID=UPI001960E990|nr:glycosyltransferase family 1 protein [Streptomyces sp. HB132]MBM7439176.1 glycosyltransferase involved in cell wall biosynthesis [Streptomyces sp. HB132]